MAYDYDKQFRGPAQHEFGYIVLGDTGTATVVTSFKRLLSGTAVHRSGAIAATPINVSTLSSGSVTLTDSAGAINAGAYVWYDLWGF